MVIEVLQGLYFLSYCPDPKQEVDYLNKKLKYLQDPLKPWVDSYIDVYNVQGSFPVYETFLSQAAGTDAYLESLNISPEVARSFTRESLTTYGNCWYQYLGSFEVKYLERQLTEASSGDEKRKITEKLQGLLARSANVQEEVLKFTELKVTSNIRARLEAKADGIIWPVERFNEQLGPLQPGIVATIFGNPASGKSSYAQNMMFINCVERPKRGCYFYLEDTPIRYQMNFLSRYSRKLEDRSKWITSSALKRDLDPKKTDIGEYLALVDEVEALMQAEMQGEIIYQSMHGFSNDPIVFGPQLARYCDKHQIDFLIVDHILRFGSFRHPDYPRVEYLNLMMSCLSNVAIGQYGNRPLAVMPIAQPNRDGEARGIKTKGHFTMFDVGEVSAVEKDSMILIGVHSDEQMRQANEMNAIVLKSRDGGSDSSPVAHYFDAPFCLVASTDNVSGGDPNRVASDDLVDIFDNGDLGANW